jgi:hypothetical protein
MRTKLFLTFMLTLLFAPVYLYAQTGDPMPDVKAAGAQAILALIPVTTLFVVWGGKLAFSKIPAAAVIFAVPVIGIVLNYAIAWLTGHPPADPILAAVFSAVATYARELVTTLGTKGMSEPVTITKFSF